MFRLRRLFAAIIVACILIGTIPYAKTTAHAATTKEKLDEAKKQEEEARKQAEQAQKDVDNLNVRKNSLNKELANFKEQLQAIFDRIAELDGQIEAKEKEISETEAELATARETEADQYESMKQRIRFMYKDSGTLYLDIIFHAKNFSDLITSSRYMESLAVYDRQKFDEYQATRIAIEELDAKLVSEKLELDGLRAEAETEKEGVMTVIENTNTKISEYTDLIADAEEEFARKEKEHQEAQNSVAALKKQLEEEERLARLAARLAWRSIDEITFDPADRYRLAILIYCEAGGEPYEGQVAVGAVVINRVLSGAFPNTVEEVIRQPYQFSPVLSGRYDKYYQMGKTTTSCYKAADAAMSGYTNVENCLFFRTPIEGYPARYQIGNHVFK
ncbi:MAG: cell wall hydrolase [Lachnospiraceae bacterium]|nr:cell wall hydrolase [Lachnospiraceae bacterium]